MRVKKRDGYYTDIEEKKIERIVYECASGLSDVDPDRVARRTIEGLHEGVSTTEILPLAVRIAASLIFEEPQYSKLAANLLTRIIVKEVESNGVTRFSQSVRLGYELGLYGDDLRRFVDTHEKKLDSLLDESRDSIFEFFGLRTFYDRYLTRHSTLRTPIESPQMAFLRVACGVSDTFEEAAELYDLFSHQLYLPSSPTLFNSGAGRSQLSSCYLLDSPEDDLEKIFDKHKDVGLLSKYAGGIGLSYSRVRSAGSFIQGTNGQSNGIIPFIKMLDSSVAAVNQGGRRKGAACVYLETWHADLMDFLELRDNVGKEDRRTHNLNIANWIPDIFMRRVKEGGKWSFFDPSDVPHFVDLYGEEFEAAYLEAEQQGLFKSQLDAHFVYDRMMRTLAQTGNGWMCFKDASNLKSNQTYNPENVIHLSNLCTEILEVTSEEETAVCNLGSLNLGKFVEGDSFNFAGMKKAVDAAVRQLDRVIDRNFYAIESAKWSNISWRPVGLGVMGLQDVFFQLGLEFDAPQAIELSARIQEAIYYQAIKTSSMLARAFGAHPNFHITRAAKGDLQPQLWGVKGVDHDFEELAQEVARTGLRNSLLIAIAPTATIADIVGCYSCVEPAVTNLFKKETLSGEFIIVNKYLVKELKDQGLWTSAIRDKIKLSEGSVQDIAEIPDHLKRRFRTAWELSMKPLIDHAAARGPFIDQSQSLNLFVENPTINKLSSMYMYLWQKGVKTSYYLRSRGKTSIAKTTVSSGEKANKSEEVLACSLENPESCVMCD